ncbi:MAG: S41 family peptidase [Acidobacteriota bacterium]|nr:S41 family peptidase [Acidobacteriota bacterium]
MKPRKSRALALFALVLGAVPAFAQWTAEQKQLTLASFEAVWSAIHEKHWEEKPAGLNWQVIHEEYRPKVEAATSAEAARAVMRDMLGRLHQTHFAIFPAAVYQVLDPSGAGDGWPGFEARVLDGRVIVTESLNLDIVKPGWEVLQSNGTDLPALVAKLQTDPAVHELQLERAITARLSGPIDVIRPLVFADASNARVAREIKLIPPRGNFSGFGNLPPQPVFFESKMLGNSGYIRFNMFLDLVRVMGQFGEAVQKCSRCDGIVIDLRGNPGGIGGMAMGMAGWLVSQQGQRLGTMYMRGATLNFAINPRAEAYGGPVAVLVDGSSASTSEIFAGGLKDLGRARIFGTRTAAAALPSVITRLPNGDGFQYAVANYISEGGQPLEGNGVLPDTEGKLTRPALLAGHDSVIDAALDWIRKQKESK